MATEEKVQSISLPAGADLRTKQGYFVRSLAGVLRLPSGAGAGVDGVLQDTPNTGEAGEMAFAGRVKVVTGDTFAIDALLTTDANGAAIEAVVTGYQVHAKALEASTAAGQLISALLFLSKPSVS